MKRLRRLRRINDSSVAVEAIVATSDVFLVAYLFFNSFSSMLKASDAVISMQPLSRWIGGGDHWSQSFRNYCAQ
ncbi:MAG: hypothetical protein ACTS6G_02620 [Candidatus Hodgkinia cicadicola]